MKEMLSVEIWSMVQTSQGNAVLLRPRDLGIAVPIFIGQLEMQSILIGREGINPPRPLTHDLFLNMLHRLSLSLEKVEVHELKNNTFHARLVISGGRFSEEEPLIMDSRPSDALALAVRRRCPILVASPIVEQAGIPLDFFLDGLEEAEEHSPAGPVPPAEALSHETEKNRRLLEQLNRAVAAEEYELAAEIRDLLNQPDEPPRYP
ncbi:MAG: bifunctional nuclease family protein [Treponema sp.]|jgi:bifunctional DNase/RNase|nr:bifunctional nuclease family protein [Treponema sp.]